ncbi:putative transcriptional activator NphR [Streptomyces afghaniensis 772]|uniref:Putative transcriptional activator NphR n=1 Tax=Streptomyces afghaniensis 772 TaxID=1283301 RepID=S4MJ87_9ACTN|nr:helix-turn-helix domain-containing protein [Streptomyces afghaniensis]EPJ36651.1 putative transcriptional activator NphR [Streptomyces afghaniensis 772]
MSVVLSTASLSATDRSELWHHAVSRTFIPLDVRLLEEEPSPGRIVSNQLGSLRISQVQAGPQTVTRSSRLIRDGKEDLILTLQQRGTAIKEQDGRQARIGPGDFSLSDSSRPFRKTVQGDFSFTSFQFPRTDLRVREEDLRAVTATAFSGQEGSAALVSAYLGRLAREAPGLDAFVGRQFAATALDLLALLVNEQCGRDPQVPETAAATLVRVKDHILRHLADPGLSPPDIAAAHRMSVRYLHKLFQLEGVTVGEWIRTQRLERCRRDLLHSPALGYGVAAVARRWGFVSPSHFSRAFRAAYGMTPREWQMHGLSGDGRKGGEDGRKGRAGRWNGGQGEGTPPRTGALHRSSPSSPTLGASCPTPRPTRPPSSPHSRP